jgi:hypothetical protein
LSVFAIKIPLRKGISLLMTWLNPRNFFSPPARPVSHRSEKFREFDPPLLYQGPLQSG